MTEGSFVALGDSFTEGIDDPYPDGSYRGWADRFAGMLAARNPELRYANLAVRGRLLGDVATEQVPAAIALGADLVSIAAGGNDLLRPGSDPDSLAAVFDSAVARLQAGGCRVLMFTGFDPNVFPVIKLIRGKAAAYNMHLRGIADARGCDLVDMWSMRVLCDRRAWSVDRLHLTSEAHQRVALRAAEVLGLPVTEDWRAPFPAPEPGSSLTVAPTARALWLAARRADAEWARTYALPWIRRRIRGTSSGDNVIAKRPELLPIEAPAT
jgi:lysophospholipase L1-like esterase